jgi:precorrin isomerase
MSTDICVDVRNWLINDDLPELRSPRMLTLNNVRELVETECSACSKAGQVRTISADHVAQVDNTAVVVNGESPQALFVVCERVVHVHRM